MNRIEVTKMTKPKLIFTNVDPSFSINSGRLSNQIINNVRKEIILGNLFIPFSQFIPKAITNITSQITTTSPLIAYNGAVALDETGRPIVSQFLKVESVLKICQQVEEIPTLTWNIYSGYNWLTQKDSPLVKQREQLIHLSAFTTSIDNLKKLKGVHEIEITGNNMDLEKIKFSSNEFKIEKDFTTIRFYAPEVNLNNTFKEVGNYFEISSSNWEVWSSLASI